MYFQSAYRKQHSTETALVHVVNDIMTAMGKKQGAISALIDLNSAFDTLDHGILLKRLEYCFGICGSALKWLSVFVPGE